MVIFTEEGYTKIVNLRIRRVGVGVLGCCHIGDRVNQKYLFSLKSIRDIF